MRCTPIVVALLAHGLALPPSLAVAAPQEAAPATQQTEVPTFGVGTAAVTLDVVVRDKKGRAVRDLKASDFAVFEDGVKQTIESFRVFGRPLDDAADEGPKAASAPAPPSPSAPPAPAPPPTETRPQVIAFVFDRLSADARNTAHKAALTYLDHGHVEGDFVGIFAIDLALQTIQPFTVEPGLIRLGVDRAVAQANTQFSSDRGQARDLAEAAMSAEAATAAIMTTTPTGPGAGSAGAGIAGGAASAAIAQAVATRGLSMLRNFEALERDQQGFASTNGLLAVVNGLKELPGRKTVVFFSEGLAIPANVVEQFKSVIHTANRANVSVYTMDAAGLRAESMDQETRKEMLQAGAKRLRQLDAGVDGGNTGSMTKALERNEDLLRLNPESGLGQLAKETGGFLIRDTNDAAAAFRRMEEDMRFHYLLAYSPSNENYDGRFRKVSVKVTRPSLQVQTREGYLAVRAAESIPLRSFEAPALAQLDRSPRPAQFPLRALALSFPTTRRPGLVPVLVHVPGNTISYIVDKDDKSGKSMHRADFSVVVRVRNEARQEVDRLGQHYLLSAPAANLEAARKGEVLFYREAELPPGKYTLEAVAYDAMTGKASVRTSTFEVPPADDTHVRLSSLMLVQRAEQVGASEPKDGPLYYGDMLLYPNMGEVYKKSTAKTIGFFFSALSPRDGPAPGEATVEVWKGAQAMGQVATPLPAPDAQGRIQQAGALPLSGFAAGAYELKVTLRDGKNVASASAPFTVEE